MGLESIKPYSPPFKIATDAHGAMNFRRRAFHATFPRLLCTYFQRVYGGRGVCFCVFKAIIPVTLLDRSHVYII